MSKSFLKVLKPHLEQRFASDQWTYDGLVFRAMIKRMTDDDIVEAVEADGYDTGGDGRQYRYLIEQIRFVAEMTRPSADVDDHEIKANEARHELSQQTATTTPTQRQGVYANAVVKDGRRIWLSVGKTGKQTFAVRHDEYYNGKWFCCDDKTGKSITAEFSFKYMLDRLESLGWAREWHELSLDPESEKHHWEQLQPILQRGRSGPLFSKVLKLNGRAPETGFDNWYIQGGYGNKAQPGEPSIRDAATELLKPEIEKLIAEIEH